ncbi:MAG TPA: protein translocase subunit SecF [Actinomycetota bacterium]|nr:protein translocase subunit SecF [Actinomycetota bacterium]
MPSIASRLYHGDISVDYVGQWRRWAVLSGVVLLISLVSLFVPGLTFGIDFKGGSVFRAEATKPVTESQVRAAVGNDVAKVVQLTDTRPVQVIVQTEELSADQVAEIRAELARVTGAEQVSNESVGSKWGSTVSRKALIALAVFIGVVIVYVSLRFEFKMAVAALVALAHDLLITAGVYALARFEVTPATVIALLTILGYSLYDTVVVFDKVRENTAELSSMSRITYSDAANKAVNQTLIRSLNTSLASLLPIAALLFVGAFALGAETLKDLSLALLIGVVVSTYSSIFVATPFLAVWKETEPRNRQLRARAARQPAPAGARATGRAAVPADRQAQPRPAGGRRRPAAQPVLDGEEAMPMPAVPPDPVEADEPDEAEPADTAPVAAQSNAGSKPRSGQQKPRSSQARRKPSGRQPSRPAKRRRR